MEGGEASLALQDRPPGKPGRRLGVPNPPESSSCLATVSINH